MYPINYERRETAIYPHEIWPVFKVMGKNDQNLDSLHYGSDKAPKLIFYAPSTENCFISQVNIC
jgi:hypothetical protein